MATTEMTNQSDAERLLACPFCKESLILRMTSQGTDYYEHPDNSCPLGGNNMSDPLTIWATPEAITAWNTRAARNPGAGLVPEGASSIDQAQRVGYFGSPEEWREACRLFRIRHSSYDCAEMSKLRTYIEEGLLEVCRPNTRAAPDAPQPASQALLQQALDALDYHVCQTRPIEKSSIAMAALHKALAQPVAPGWQLVPLEMTREMENAVIKALGWCEEDVAAAEVNDDERIDLRVAHRAALSAAPSMPPKEGV